MRPVSSTTWQESSSSTTISPAECTVELGATSVLRKPYGTGELAVAVDAALNPNAARSHAA
jgi:hypothetical protein